MIEALTRAEYDAFLRRDFALFAARCFGDLNPQTELAMNWHLEVIAAKLAAVRQGKIRRLIINLPPRRLKSHRASIAFPAWCLGHNPSQQILCVSYAQDLDPSLQLLKYRRLPGGGVENVLLFHGGPRVLESASLLDPEYPWSAPLDGPAPITACSSPRIRRQYPRSRSRRHAPHGVRARSSRPGLRDGHQNRGASEQWRAPNSSAHPAMRRAA
jgi:hypothetical protein